MYCLLSEIDVFVTKVIKMTEQNNSNQPNNYAEVEKAAHNIHAAMGAFHGASRISEGIEEQDMGKVGEGVFTVGIVGAGTASVAAPAIASVVTGVAGAAAGTAVVTAFMPVSIGAICVGGVLWGLDKIFD